MVIAPRLRSLVVGALEEGIGTWTEPLRTRSSSVITLSTRLPGDCKEALCGAGAWVGFQPIDKPSINMWVHGFLRNFKPPPPKYLDWRGPINSVYISTDNSILDVDPTEPSVIRTKPDIRVAIQAKTKMPAPTALLKPSSAPETIPLPAPEQDDELILDVQENDFADPNTGLPPVDVEDTEMAVDEEGRPKFAPGKDIVSLRCPAATTPGLLADIRLVTGPSSPHGNKKNPYPAKSNVCTQEQLEQGECESMSPCPTKRSSPC